MRQSRFVIPLLVVLLVAVSGGVWYLLHDSGGASKNTPDVANHADTARDDTRPLENGVPDTPEKPEVPNLPEKPDQPDVPVEPASSDQPQPPVNHGETVSPDAPKPVEKTFTATVRGRVTIKSDGRSAVGASVAVVTTGENVVLTGSAVTDSAGEYTMHVQAVGRAATGDFVRTPEIHVTASMPGYAVSRSGPLQLWRSDEALVVNLALAPPAAVKGRVVDAITREGLAAAAVTLQDFDSMRDGSSAEYALTTDAEGHFVANNIPAGAYFISVKAASYSDFSGWTNPGRIMVSAGVTTDVGEIAMSRFATIVGRVVDPSGQPVEGARVTRVNIGGMGAWRGDNVSTDEEGRFEMRHVEPGQYTLRAELSGFAPAEISGVIAVADQTLDVGDIALLAGHRIRGEVRDGAGKGIPGAQVAFEAPGTGTAFGMAETSRSLATCDEAGRFDLNGVPTADGYLRATAEDYAPTRMDLKVSGDMDGIVITLHRGGTVKGRVVDATGAPVASTGVSAIRQDSNEYKAFKSQSGMMFGAMWSDQGPRAQTAEDGTFEIKNIPAGMHLILTADSNLSFATRDDVNVEDGKVVDIGDLRFEGPGRARITITEDGEPVPELKVNLGRFIGWGNGALEMVTDGAGVAAFEDVPPGTWYVWTVRDEAMFDSDNMGRRVTVRAGQTAELTIELRRRDGVSLSGRLTLHDRAVFTDVMLVGVGDRAGVLKNARLLDGGYYELNNIKTGRYVLHARQSDTSISCKVPLDLDKEGERTFDHDFAGFKIAGTVTTPEDSPAQRGAVQLVLQHENPESREMGMWLRGRVNAGGDGAFAFNDVSPGRYLLTATLDGVGTVDVPVTVQADVTGLKLEISGNAGSLKVTISKLVGTPVSGGMFGLLNLQRPDGTDVQFSGQNQGFFMVGEKASHTLTTLPPGTYRLEVRASGYLPRFVEAVKIEPGTTTQVEYTLTAAAELHVTFTNEGLTQEVLDTAVVHFIDAEGAETLVEPNLLDMWDTGALPDVPTVMAKYIGPEVALVRIKVPGYAEILVPVEFAAGRKITKQESLIAE